MLDTFEMDNYLNLTKLNSNMNFFRLLPLIMILTKSCTYTVEIEEFTKEETAMFSYYQNNKTDTIFFESNTKDLDTILFDSLDFMVNNISSFMSSPNRQAHVQVFYLPFPNIYNFNQYNDSIPEDSRFMLSMVKGNYSDPTSILISYRSFWGEIENISQTKQDSLLDEFGIKEYWLVEKSGYSSDRDNEAYDVEKVIWTREFGLTGYYLKSGDYYKIKI